MSARRVRVVGGGLTGIVAALEAKRLGADEVVLHERFDALGGVALTQRRFGVEVRDATIWFGPPGDPLNALFEAHGLSFDAFDNRFGSVSADAAGHLLYTEDFGGPAWDAGDPSPRGPLGESLAARFSAYPAPVAERLEAYCRWHLGAEPQALHESAAVPLAVNRVWARDADPAALAASKRADPLWDELWAVPRALWGRTENLQASIPHGGFDAFFRGCHEALKACGVRVEPCALVSPREALAFDPAAETLVWAANPMPLFKALDLAAPALVRKTFRTATFEAGWDGPAPFYVQNFTCSGVIFRLHLYRSAGRTLATAECVDEASDLELRREAARLTDGFGAPVRLGGLIAEARGPRWIYHSVAAVRGLKALRATLAARFGDAFVPGGWEPYAKARKVAEVRAGLARALGDPARRTLSA